MILALFHDRKSLAQVGALKGALEDCFGPYGFRAQEQGYLYVPFSGRMLNAARLLKYLQQASGARPSLWLVDGKLHYPGIGWVFGCSAEHAAILSTAVSEPQIMIKEALHETGHLLGLEHCRRDCVMKLSIYPRGDEKPSALCPHCSAQLLAGIHR